MTAPRHAAPEAPEGWGFRIPAHYLTPETQDRPLVLLMHASALGDAVASDDDLPVGVGVTPRPDVIDMDPCQDCGATAWAWVQDGQEDGPGDTECLVCLTTQAGVSYGVVPAMHVAWVGVE